MHDERPNPTGRAPEAEKSAGPARRKRIYAAVPPQFHRVGITKILRRFWRFGEGVCRAARPRNSALGEESSLSSLSSRRFRHAFPPPKIRPAPGGNRPYGPAAILSGGRWWAPRKPTTPEGARKIAAPAIN